MMRSILQNIYVQAVLKTLVTLAVSHAVVLAGVVVGTGDYNRLNIFKILGMTDFFPILGTGWGMTGISMISYSAIFLFFLLRTEKRKRT